MDGKTKLFIQLLEFTGEVIVLVSVKFENCFNHQLEEEFYSRGTEIFIHCRKNA